MREQHLRRSRPMIVFKKDWICISIISWYFCTWVRYTLNWEKSYPSQVFINCWKEFFYRKQLSLANYSMNLVSICSIPKSPRVCLNRSSSAMVLACVCVAYSSQYESYGHWESLLYYFHYQSFIHPSWNFRRTTFGQAFLPCYPTRFLSQFEFRILKFYKNPVCQVLDWVVTVVDDLSCLFLSFCCW